jgi:hypothetical protein
MDKLTEYWGSLWKFSELWEPETGIHWVAQVIMYQHNEFFIYIIIS